MIYIHIHIDIDMLVRAGMADKCPLHSWKASRMSLETSMARRPGQLRLAAWIERLGEACLRNVKVP